MTCPIRKHLTILGHCFRIGEDSLLHTGLQIKFDNPGGGSKGIAAAIIENEELRAG